MKQLLYVDWIFMYVCRSKISLNQKMLLIATCFISFHMKRDWHYVTSTSHTTVTHEFRYYFSFCYCNIVWEDCCAVLGSSFTKGYLRCKLRREITVSWCSIPVIPATNTCHQVSLNWNLLTLKVLNFWKFTSYCSLKPLLSGMGDVVPARTSPTLHPPSPPTVHQLSWLAL